MVFPKIDYEGGNALCERRAVRISHSPLTPKWASVCGKGLGPNQSENVGEGIGHSQPLPHLHQDAALRKFNLWGDRHTAGSASHPHSSLCASWRARFLGSRHGRKGDW